MDNDLLNFLREKFPTLAKEELDLFVSQWTIEKQINRNEILIDTTIYFVKSGTLKIVAYKDSSPNKENEVIFGFGYPNSCIFNMPFYLADNDNLPYTSKFYIQAIKKCHLLGISKEKFEATLKNNNIIQHIWQKNIHSLLLHFSQRELEFSIQTSEERYNNLILSNPILLHHIPQKYIANYLKMSPETLSRIQAKEIFDLSATS